MKPSFCAIANRQAKENLIGTAGHYQTYVLIECPLPWAAKAFNSESIPPELRHYIKATKAERSIQFLAINRGVSAARTAFSRAKGLSVLVYEQAVPSQATSSKVISDAYKAIANYRGYEYQVDDLAQVKDCLEAHWQGDRLGNPITQKDILVCTHGMRDKCCARFGQPFFRDALRSTKKGMLPNTRVWKVSHIGGHRFAPTAICMPDGRYYGHLSLATLQSIITRSGPVEQLPSVYRGWGLLPVPLQVLEQQLMQSEGWSWFDSKIAYRILSDSASSEQSQASKKSPSSQMSKASRQASDQPSAKRELSVEVSIEVLAEASAEMPVEVPAEVAETISMESAVKPGIKANASSDAQSSVQSSIPSSTRPGGEFTTNRSGGGAGDRTGDRTDNRPTCCTKTYRATIVQDPQQTICVKTSCSNAVAMPIVKYTVTDCVLVNEPQKSNTIKKFNPSLLS